MLFLRQSTASQTVLIGPFVDETDGITDLTGLTINNTDIRLSKNGANIAAKNSGGATHDELGWYQITLDATDTNTVGKLQLIVHVSGALQVFHEYVVLEEAIYDAYYASAAAGNPPQLVDDIWDEDVVAAHGTADTAGLLLRALGAAISQRSNNATLNAILGVSDVASQTIPQEVLDFLMAHELNSITGATFENAILKLADVWGSFSVNDASATTTSWVTDITGFPDDWCVDLSLRFINGALAGQSKPVLSFNGTSKVITVSEAFTSAPANGTNFVLGVTHVHPASQVADTVWDEARADHVIAGSFGEGQNIVELNGNSSAAANLAVSAGQIIQATVDTVVNGHTPTTTEFQADDITEATNNHYNGRIVIFTSGVLAGQATDITDYTNVGGIGQFTVTAMTEAPSNNDTFVIV